MLYSRLRKIYLVNIAICLYCLPIFQLFLEYWCYLEYSHF